MDKMKEQAIKFNSSFFYVKFVNKKIFIAKLIIIATESQTI